VPTIIELLYLNFACIEHEATLTITLEQSSDSTTVTFTLEGVPKGMEGEIERNLEGY